MLLGWASDASPAKLLLPVLCRDLVSRCAPKVLCSAGRSGASALPGQGSSLVTSRRWQGNVRGS